MVKFTDQIKLCFKLDSFDYGTTLHETSWRELKEVNVLFTDFHEIWYLDILINFALNRMCFDYIACQALKNKFNF
jgi:hypothetical protein